MQYFGAHECQERSLGIFCGSAEGNNHAKERISGDRAGCNVQHDDYKRGMYLQTSTNYLMPTSSQVYQWNLSRISNHHNSQVMADR